MEPFFQLDCLDTILILRDFDGSIIKTSKQLENSFYQMHYLGKDIYLDRNNTYWKKSVKTICHDHKEYNQEEYVNVTNLCLENERLLSDLKRDPLTKIPNINAVHEKINSILMKKQDCVIAMCDVNDFKSINDNYGHASGDRALIEISKLFVQSIQNNFDLVARIGGDEFLFIFTSTNQSGTVEKLATLREEVKQLGSILNIPLSISIGVASFNSGDDFDQKQCEADGALYYVKHNIKNKDAIAYLDHEKQTYDIYSISKNIPYQKHIEK